MNLPFTPSDIEYVNGKFYYIYKEHLYEYDESYLYDKMVHKKSKKLCDENKNADDLDIENKEYDIEYNTEKNNINKLNEDDRLKFNAREIDSDENLLFTTNTNTENFENIQSNDNKENTNISATENKINHFSIEENIKNNKLSIQKHSKIDRKFFLVKPIRIQFSMKVYTLNKQESTLILTNRKILVLDNYKITSQLFGPTLYITRTSIYKNKILAICFGTKNIYLFENNIFSLFVCDEQPVSCYMIDDDEFLIGCEKGLYRFNTKSKKSYKSYSFGHVTAMIMMNQKIFVGCFGEMFIIDKEKVYQTKLQGSVAYYCDWNGKLVVAIRNMNKSVDHEFKYRQYQHYLHIYEVE
ncbi:hypothetical protein COBT_003549 [Conglomerata obtusa]